MDKKSAFTIQCVWRKYASKHVRCIGCGGRRNLIRYSKEEPRVCESCLIYRMNGRDVCYHCGDWLCDRIVCALKELNPNPLPDTTASELKHQAALKIQRAWKHHSFRVRLCFDPFIPCQACGSNCYGWDYERYRYCSRRCMVDSFNERW